MNGIIAIVIFVSAVVNLILFFKIWGMTNDVDWLSRQVDEITKQVCKPCYEVKFADYYLSGEYEEAYKYLNHCFAYDIRDYFIEFSDDCNKSPKITESIMSIFRSSSETVADDSPNYTETITKLVEKYKPLYELIGKEIPENIRNVTYETAHLLFEAYEWNVTFR